MNSDASGKDHGYLYVKGELLVAPEGRERKDVDAIMAGLVNARPWTPQDDKDMRAPERPNPKADSSHVSRRAARQDYFDALTDRGIEDAGLFRYVVDRLRAPGRAKNDIPEIVKKTRSGRQHDTSIPLLYPHHVVTFCEGDAEYGPYGNAVRIANFSSPPRLPQNTPVDAGAGKHVGVVDTGVYAEHDYIQDVVQSGPNDFEELSESGGSTLDREAGHGTFVTGIIHTFAPAATIHARATQDDDGAVRMGTVAGALQSFRNNPDVPTLHVVNLSLGGWEDPGGVDPYPAVTAALVGLKSDFPGLTVFAAAGNLKKDEVEKKNHGQPYKHRKFYPAALHPIYPWIVAVGARTANGKNNADFSVDEAWVTAWEIGVGLESSYVGSDATLQPGGQNELARARWQGTSFACAVATGKEAAKP